MTTDGVALDDLATKVDDKVASPKGSDEFKIVSSLSIPAAPSGPH